MTPHKIALAGNPNVGKSTVFNTLTGMNQHTGNWPGKTVENAFGTTTFHDQQYTIYDLPGTYSLISHSEEEKIARDFICFEEYDAIIVVCDAVCLERNLNLALQIMEITNKVIICVNLLDEAKKKKINIDINKLSQILKVPVVGTSAREKIGINELMQEVENLTLGKTIPNSINITYPKELEHAKQIILKELKHHNYNCNKPWIALKLLDDDTTIINAINHYYHNQHINKLKEKVKKAKQQLLKSDITTEDIKEITISTLVSKAEEIAKETIHFEKQDYNKKDRQIDKLLTNKWTGIPIMLLMLMGIFWITIEGANIPSNLLFIFFQTIEDYLINILTYMHLPDQLISMLIEGVYRTVTWIISVMLPPMAIFFPLFTILEDLGVLPRIAFNLDKCFQKCCTCGKQALTMCMGFGCNAAAIVGCRIIDSPRERLIAIITNNFVPCNGRFPTIISIITMFFIGFQTNLISSIKSVLILTGVIILGILMTFIISKLLSKTLLKGLPSSFTLELPPYRKPQFGKVIIRSIFDRTLFVLGRAITVAIPAGFIIWIMANITISEESLLTICSNFLDPFAQIFGLDGVILMAFLLGFPANEIVIPIMIMAYMQTGAIGEFNNLIELKNLLINNGWTWITAICVMLFSLMHFPCSTTCLTIKKETNSWKWTIVSFLIPTITGLVICGLVANISKLLLII